MDKRNSLNLRDFLRHNSVDVCVCLKPDQVTMTAIISALNPESLILHHVPRPDKNGGGVGCLITKSLQYNK